MKATYLMIGDIIMAVGFDEENVCDYRFPVRITSIDKYSSLGMNGNCPFMWECINDEDSWREECYVIEPIPLTEDILKANGFTTSNDYSFHYNWITLQTDNIAIGFSIWICGRGLMLKYAHELQHALRLCGLSELADNFVTPLNR